MLGQNLDKSARGSVTIALKKIPALYARDPDKARLIKILADYFRSPNVVVHPPKHSQPFAPGFVNFTPSLAEFAIETWGNITDLVIEELNLKLEMSFIPSASSIVLLPITSSPKPVCFSTFSDPHTTNSLNKAFRSRTLSAPFPSQKLSHKQTFPYTIFINDLPAAFYNDPRVITIIKAQFPFGEIEANPPRRSGQKYVSLFVNYRDKLDYIIDAEPFGSEGVLQIREVWLRCDLRVEKRRGDNEEVSEKNEIIKNDLSQSNTASWKACEVPKKSVTKLSNKFDGLDMGSSVSDLSSSSSSECEKLNNYYPAKKDELVGTPALVLWNLDAVNWFDEPSTCKLSEILHILTSVLKFHCGCISVTFEIAVLDSTLLSGKLSTAQLEDFFNVKRINDVCVCHPESGIVEALEKRFETWRAVKRGVEQKAAVLFMTGQLDLVYCH
ncbi:hypothetical protein HK096_007054 [Nowakowskiella sp. JEL0078]|nr:hypothetical protein HK096_007054 [Nowakowskiella sp. JEL0078]